MATLPDLLYVAVFAVAAPLIDYAVFWPALRRLLDADPAWARRWLWATSIGNLWVLVALGAALWMANGRTWASFGFTLPGGWRLWVVIVLVLLQVGYHALAIMSLMRSADARARLREQAAPVAAVMPHNRTDLAWFAGVSLTAGFCEEFLYRGYFIWALTPWLGWWGAAALSLVFFSIGHLYQGWNGVLRVGIVAAIYTLVVALTGSLWPAIVLHALVDLGAGVMTWLALDTSPTSALSSEAR